MRAWPVDLGSYHFTRENILKFARKYDPQPFHLSDEGGLRGPFGGLSASGWHTASGWMKCFVEVNDVARAKLQADGKTLPEVGPGPGFTNLKWLKPVYPGDTVRYSCRVIGKTGAHFASAMGHRVLHERGHQPEG